MTKAVLWDMDGTLVDSIGHHWTAWRDVAAEVGFNLSYDTFIAMLGKRNDEIALEWFGPGMPEPERTRVSLDKEARYRSSMRAAGIEPLPGVMDWLSRLRDAGWKQAIATAAPRLNEEAVVDALRLAPWFDARVTAEDVTRGKPFPDVFLTAADRLGVPPSRAIVVEDAAAGIAAGRAAGMKTIGVCPHGPLPGADLWVRSLTELPPDAFDSLLER
ncbi:MAG: HAD-IA family hydrolase [Vicinamibacterales bacterium]|nr:HAD-IA family hydrolase [Vicinamibacterales bacterium]